MPPEAESRDDQGWTWKPPLKATKSASSAGGAQKVHEGPLTRSHSAPPTEHYRNALATGDDDNDDTDSKPPLQVRVSAGAGREADEEEDGDQWGEESARGAACYRSPSVMMTATASACSQFSSTGRNFLRHDHASPRAARGWSPRSDKSRCCAG
jgi:hypothetical protein